MYWGGIKQPQNEPENGEHGRSPTPMRDIDHFQDSRLNFMFGAFGDYLMIGQQRIATRTQDNKMNSQTIDHHNNSNNKNGSKLCDQIEY